MELSRKRTSRPTTNTIKTALRSIKDEVPELKEIFGFGSYFRSPNADDCDVLLVIRGHADQLGSVHARLSAKFAAVGRRLGIRFDVTVLTESEHLSRPLHEHQCLIPLG